MHVKCWIECLKVNLLYISFSIVYKFWCCWVFFFIYSIFDLLVLGGKLWPFISSNNSLIDFSKDGILTIWLDDCRICDNRYFLNCSMCFTTLLAFHHVWICLENEHYVGMGCMILDPRKSCELVQFYSLCTKCLCDCFLISIYDNFMCCRDILVIVKYFHLNHFSFSTYQTIWINN